MQSIKRKGTTASNFTGRSRVAVIYDDEYYQSYEDVFMIPHVMTKTFTLDYGPQHNQFMRRYDFNHIVTPYIKTLTTREQYGNIIL